MEDTRVLENVVGNTQVLWQPAQILKSQGLSLAGKVIKISSSLSFEDALLGNAPE